MNKLPAIALTATLGFLVATNPVVTHAAATITGKDIKNGSVTGKDVKNSSLKGKDVKDSSLTGADLKDRSLTGEDVLIRVATASKAADAITGHASPTVAVTTSITAPTNGVLVMSASSDVFNSNSADVVTCWLQVDSDKVVPSERTMQLGANNTEENCATNASYAVFPGQHTVDLVGDMNLGTTNFDETALTVIFIPYGKAGEPIVPAA